MDLLKFETSLDYIHSDFQVSQGHTDSVLITAAAATTTTKRQDIYSREI